MKSKSTFIIILIAFGSIWSANCYGQDNASFSSNIEKPIFAARDGAAFDNTSVKDSNNQDDVVIINEENTISFDGQNIEFIYFTIAKKVHYKVHSMKGIEKISTFILPETFDPTYISHFPPTRKYTHVYSRMKCEYFKAEIISKNGDKKEAQIEESVEEVQMHMLEENYYGTYNKFIYQVQNLEIGDDLIVEYNYNMPYDENFFELSSFRIFFQSDIFKEHYQLSIEHDAELVVEFNYFNDAEPDSVITEGKKKKHYWSRENLNGCIQEPGSRPYLHLPNIIFNTLPYSLLYVVPHSEEKRFTPFYSLYVRQREKNHFGISVSMLQGVNTRQYEQIERFIKDETKEIFNDNIGYDKLSKIHNTIVDEFDFADDLDYFTREDRRDPRMGDYVSQRQIRDIARYDIYLTLILSLDLNYFTTYICDKRSGVIGDDFLTPMFQGDYMFTLLMDDDKIVYLYPKKSRFGYYLNEIPFYFENARARLVHVNDYRNIEVPVKEEFREIYTPISKMGDNIRNSRIKVDINVDELSATFNAQVNLSGQFSTMTRGAYQFNYQDETVNELYGKKICELNDGVQLIRNDVEIRKKEPPFPTRINAKYLAKNLLTRHNDTISLDIKNWFNHIVYENLEIDNRQMDFYPDFANRDTYSYFIQFDSDISLIRGIENVEINNELASFIINIEQVDSKSIKIESHFAISNKIEVENIGVIEDIYNRIEELNNGRVDFILK